MACSVSEANQISVYQWIPRQLGTVDSVELFQVLLRRCLSFSSSELVSTADSNSTGGSLKSNSGSCQIFKFFVISGDWFLSHRNFLFDFWIHENFLSFQFGTGPRRAFNRSHWFQRFKH